MGANDLLLVDDDHDMLEVIGMLLDAAGYSVRTATNGQEALEAVADHMPALIVLDMIMPVMDGRQFVQVFRERYGGAPPIVVLTAAEHARSRCQGLEVSDVLPKPFDVTKLMEVVERYVSHPAQGSP